MPNTPQLIQWKPDGFSTFRGEFPLGITTFVFSVWHSHALCTWHASCLNWSEGPLGGLDAAKAACELRLQRIAEQIRGTGTSPTAPVPSIKPSDPVLPEKLLIMGFVRSGIDPSVLVYADAVVYESRDRRWRINAEYVPTALQPQCLGDVWKMLSHYYDA